MLSIKRYLIASISMLLSTSAFAGTILLLGIGTGAPGSGGGGPTCDGSLQLMLCSASGSIVVHAP